MRLLTLSYCSSSARTIICAFGSDWLLSKRDEAVGTFGIAGTPTHGGFASENWAAAGRKPKAIVMAVAQIRVTHRPRPRPSPGRASIAPAITPPPGHKPR